MGKRGRLCDAEPGPGFRRGLCCSGAWLWGPRGASCGRDEGEGSKALAREGKRTGSPETAMVTSPISCHVAGNTKMSAKTKISEWNMHS